jgi:hypothetical protein
MNLASMTTQLQEIYTRFETDAAPYTRGAVCMEFGKAHGIVINRFMAARTPGGRSHSAIAALSRSIPGGAR